MSMDDLFMFTVLHLWRHPKTVPGCEGCTFLSGKPTQPTPRKAGRGTSETPRP